MKPKFWIFFGVCAIFLSVYSDGVVEYLRDIEYFANLHGFMLHSYEAKTEDGYLLTLHRIPGRLGEGLVKKKPPVFLMHGILLSSFDWLLLGNRSMGFILADAGYDVWIGNNRGNTYSRMHTHLNPNIDAQFWQYSYNEIGLYDLPAMINKVLEVTGERKLTYLGYSEGVTSFLVMGSQRPEYNKKIKTMHAFAPVTDMYRVKSPALSFIKTFFLPYVAPVLKFFNIYEIMTVRYFAPFVEIALNIPLLGPMIARYIIHTVGGSYKQLSLGFLKHIFINFPAGVSLRQMEHYAQGSSTGHFRPYYENGPPKADYNLSRVTVPMFMYYAQDDYLVNNDILVGQVAPRLNVKKLFKIPGETLNHVDFLWGNDVSAITTEALRDINDNNR